MQGTEPAPADAVAEVIDASGLFDRAWYLQCNDDVAAAGADPLRHYIEYGRNEDRWPNRYFDPVWYRESNPDVAKAGADPVLHYIRHGEAEGRRPHCLFDTQWYRRAWAIPAGQPVLAHFLANRLTGAVVPCAGLFAVPLTAPYREDQAAGIDPIAHYLDDLLASGQQAFPDLPVVRDSGLLEDNYYLINAFDVYEAKLDPASHYCRFGWREYRKPNIYFDPGWYAETNPEVIRLQINPLVHYILVGEPAGRRPTAYFDPAWYRRQYELPDDRSPLRHYLSNRRLQNVSPTPLFDVDWYVSRSAGDLQPGRDPFLHYLQAGTTRDVDPSRNFDAARYRRTHLGRPSRGFVRTLKPAQHNPLVHYLRSEYTALTPGA